jgi:uncharacterized protein YneR
MKYISLCLLMAVMVMSSGCASLLTNHVMTKRDAQARRAVQVNATPGGATVAVDLFSLQAIKDHPWQTAVAALVDGLSFYGVYRVAEHNRWFGLGSDDDDPPSQKQEPKQQNALATGQGDNYFVNTGDYSPVSIRVNQPIPEPQPTPAPY